MYSFSNAYLTIPYTIVVANDGTNLRFKVEDQANIYAASLKSSACIVDWISCKFDGAQLTRSSYHNHLMMNEKLKTYTNDKFKIYGDIMGHAWDNGAGINYVPTGVGEVNNNIVAPTTSVGTGGLNPTQQVNSGHIERCRKNNIDVTKRTNSSLNSFLYKDDSINIGLRDTCNQNVLVLVPSFSEANVWQAIGAKIITENIEYELDLLKKSTGNFIVLANRYDGIDLGGGACNVLIIHEHPKYKFLKNRYLENIFHTTNTNIIAQTIEQGMGRTVRSGDDYSVIYLFGKNIFVEIIIGISNFVKLYKQFFLLF
jgi:hypothetical protein